MEESQYMGAVLHMSSVEGRRLCITGISLVDPAFVPGESVVNVWAEVGQEKRVIGTLSSREPVVAAVPPVVLGGEFILRHDLPVPAAVRLNVRVLGPPSASSSDVVEEEGFLVLGEDVEEVVDEEEEDEPPPPPAVRRVEYEPMTEEDMAERYDSDNGDDDVESRKRNSAPLVAAPPGSVVPGRGFLGWARFAVAGNTAGFIRFAAADAATGGNEEESSEIVVLYRYTRFSRASGGRRGVEACRRTKLHRLHFAVPPAGDMASSLAWAGSSLGALIYPGLFRRQLAELWTSLLAAPAATKYTIVPPRAGRLQVIVDAGILRREDYTAERMAHMRGELVDRMMTAWPAYYHVVKELHLPEPLPAAANRMIADDEEECCVCFESLDSGLAAWPGCGHVFHSACVEKTLERSEMCPLCRHRLSDPLVRKTATKMDPRALKSD